MLLMLTWFARVLLSPAQPRHRRQRGDVSLNSLKRLTLHLVIGRASELTQARRHHAFFWRGKDHNPPNFFRSLVGSALRRAVRHKDIATLVSCLIGVLLDLDAYAHAVAKRMRRAFTRLWPILTESAPPARLARAPSVLLSFTDSS